MYLIRSTLTLTYEKTITFEIVYIQIIMAQIFLRNVKFFFQKESFADLSEMLDDFLEGTKRKSIKKIEFIQIWDKNKPKKFLKYCYLIMTCVVIIWILHTFYKCNSSIQNVCECVFCLVQFINMSQFSRRFTNLTAPLNFYIYFSIRFFFWLKELYSATEIVYY